MCDPIRKYGQYEYTRVLRSHSAAERGLSQSQCENLLIEHGADQQQAKNGAYVFLHHQEHQTPSRRGTQKEYDRILNQFDAKTKRPIECIRHLEQQGFSYGQAKSAVYTYRSSRSLIGR